MQRPNMQRQKIDLNKANIRAFQEYASLYPTVARKIVQHAPFRVVEDVLDIPGLSPNQLHSLMANLDNFTVSHE